MNNDRLKFRIFNTNTGEYETLSGINENGKFFYFIFPNGNLYLYNNRTYELVDDTLMVERCTGLRDKNGNLMYAGDRVRAIMPDSRPIGETAGYSEYTKETTGIIKWNDRCAGFVIEDVNKDLVFFYEIADSEDIEIIGNIHTQKDGE